jgi:hypothetical protein
MAELIITVQRAAGGGTQIGVGLRSGPDVLPHEHEANHRQLVAALLPSAGGVKRERPAREPVVG